VTSGSRCGEGVDTVGLVRFRGVRYCRMPRSGLAPVLPLDPMAFVSSSSHLRFSVIKSISEGERTAFEFSKCSVLTMPGFDASVFSATKVSWAAGNFMVWQEERSTPASKTARQPLWVRGHAMLVLMGCVAWRGAVVCGSQKAKNFRPRPTPPRHDTAPTHDTAPRHDAVFGTCLPTFAPTTTNALRFPKQPNRSLDSLAMGGLYFGDLLEVPMAAYEAALDGKDKPTAVLTHAASLGVGTAGSLEHVGGKRAQQPSPSGPAQTVLEGMTHKERQKAKKRVRRKVERQEAAAAEDADAAPSTYCIDPPPPPPLCLVAIRKPRIHNTPDSCRIVSSCANCVCRQTFEKMRC
jgi:hypothetical protein